MEDILDGLDTSGIVMDSGVGNVSDEFMEPKNVETEKLSEYNSFLDSTISDRIYDKLRKVSYGPYVPESYNTVCGSTSNNGRKSTYSSATRTVSLSPWGKLVDSGNISGSWGKVSTPDSMRLQKDIFDCMMDNVKLNTPPVVEKTFDNDSFDTFLSGLFNKEVSDVPVEESSKIDFDKVLPTDWTGELTKAYGESAWNSNYDDTTIVSSALLGWGEGT